MEFRWGVLHCGVNPAGPCNETNGIAASRACPGSQCAGNFHTYRFEWDRSVSPNQLRRAGRWPSTTWRCGHARDRADCVGGHGVRQDRVKVSGADVRVPSEYWECELRGRAIES
jgi:hypothetical protein